MAELEFTKMHGAGNDFIMIDDRESALHLSPSLIKAICAAHTGVGADGLIIIRKSKEADFRMIYYNSDGTEAELCGNGARCTALFAFSKGIAGRTMSFETLSGILKASIDDGRVTVDVADVTDLETDIGIVGLDGEIDFGVCGVPHSMLIVDDVDKISDEEFVKLGKMVRFNDRFDPEGTNFNVVTVVDEHTIKYRTYERGVEDETLACGTGAVTISVLCAHSGLVQSPVKCITRGGDMLDVSFELSKEGAVSCRLSGPAVIVFDGRLYTESLL